jgi:arylsulfatase A-like enzyme
LEHGNSAFDELLRVPFILSAPGFRTGARILDPVRAIDVFPTLVDLLGLAPPPGLSGTRLTPLLQGGRAAAPPAISEIGSLQDSDLTGVAIRSSDWKLIQQYEPPSVKLYDLKRDPGERRDVAADHAAVAAGLLRQLAVWRAALNAANNTTSVLDPGSGAH